MLNAITTVCSAYGQNIVRSLDIMWKGMLAIFIAIGLVFAAITIMNTVTKKIKLAKKAKAVEKSEE